GVSEDRVSLRAPDPGDIAARPPLSATTEPSAPARPSTTATTGPPPTAPPGYSGPGGAASTPSTTEEPAAGDPCPAPAVTEFALPAGTKPGALAAAHDGSVWFT